MIFFYLPLVDATGGAGRAQFNHYPVLIAADGSDASLHEQVGCSSRFERPAEVVAEIHDLVDAERRNIRKHGFKRHAVAVDVGDRSQFHRFVPCPGIIRSAGTFRIVARPARISW